MKKIFNILMIITLPLLIYAQNKEKISEIPKGSVVNTQSLAQELKEKENMLKRKESELNAMEERLKVLEQDIISRENNLKRMQKDVVDKLDELKGKEDEEVTKLAKIYSATKAKSAARILINMELDKAISVFRRMTPSAAGKILNEMGKVDPVHASKITTGLTPQPVFNEDNK